MNTFYKIASSIWWSGFWLAYSFFFLIFGSMPVFWLLLIGVWSFILGVKLYSMHDERQHQKYLEARYIQVPTNQESK